MELRAYWLLLRQSFYYCCKSSFMDQGMRRLTLPMFDFYHVANNNSARSQLPYSPHGLLPGQVILPSHLLQIFQTRRPSWFRTRRTTSKDRKGNILTRRSFFHFFPIYVSQQLWPKKYLQRSQLTFTCNQQQSRANHKRSYRAA